MNDDFIVQLINQIHDLDKKASAKEEKSLLRNINRIKELIQEEGFLILNPIGEAFDDTRTDCEASIAGDQTEKLKIVEVIKPVVYKKSSQGEATLIQRGIVIAEGK